MLSVYASAAAVAFVAVVIAAHRLLRRRAQRPPARARVIACELARHVRSGEVHLDLTTDQGPVALDLSPFLAAVIARELTGADPKRTH